MLMKLYYNPDECKLCIILSMSHCAIIIGITLEYIDVMEYVAYVGYLDPRNDNFTRTKTTLNPLSPHDVLKHHFTFLKTHLIFLQQVVLE